MAATAHKDVGSPELWGWLEAEIGGSVRERRRLIGGNSRTTWSVDVDGPDGIIPLVLRTDSGEGPFSDTPLTLGREAAVYGALDGRGVKIPHPYAYNEGLGALAIERVQGEEVWDAATLDAVLAELARLHAIDARSVTLPGVGRRAHDDLELWAEIAARRVAPASPVVQLAVELLREHFPGEPGRIVVVHGDAGPGNLLWHDGALSALLDWELTHFGDPHDDLAFLSVRAWLFGYSLPAFGDQVRSRYAAATGLALDPARLRYWQAVGVLRNLVTCLSSVGNLIAGRDRLVHHMLIPTLDRVLVGMLAELEGVALEPTPPPADPGALPGGEVIAEIAAELSGLARAIEDPEQRQRARRARYLLSQLERTWPLAFDIARADGAEPVVTDTAGRLQRLARMADRRLALFPRARELAGIELASLASTGLTGA